jgi:hypothetical protein
MTDSFSRPPSGRSRSSHHLLWWLLGIVGAVALVVGLFLLVTPIVLLQNWSSHGDEVEQAQAEQDRQSALSAQDRLRAAAADGGLTDLEIADAVGRLWSIQRTSQQIRVTTGYHAAEPVAGCYVLVLTVPLGPSSKGSLEVGTPCPRGPALAPTASRSDAY